MRIRSAVPAVVLASAVVLATIGGAAAHAVGSAIHAGDSLYAIATDPSYPNFQLLGVDPATGFSTTIGAGSAGPSGQAYQPAYDAVTGKSYYVQSIPLSTFALASIDTATGE